MQQQQQQIEPAGESTQVTKLDSQPQAAPESPSGPTEGQALLQDVGLRKSHPPAAPVPVSVQGVRGD